MPRSRYQRGTLKTTVTEHGKTRQLPRGTFYARWHQYVVVGGKEIRRKREKIFDRDLAEKHRITLNYPGPLNKSDARRVLDILIAQDTGIYTAPDAAVTFGNLAREYLALSSPNWSSATTRVNTQVIEQHLISPLGDYAVTEIKYERLQVWLNGYVEKGLGDSHLRKMLYHVRAIFEHAMDKELIARNPARKLRARSQRTKSDAALTVEECRRLIGALIGRDQLIVRMFIQLGLRPEEMFALRWNDVQWNRLVIDEAIVERKAQRTKTDASANPVYLPEGLRGDILAWIETSGCTADAWLFRNARGGPLHRDNYLHRVLKPAGVRAGLMLIQSRKGKKTSALNFQVLRRTCGTLFGRHAGARDVQAQLRHSQPGTTLRHYQQAVPESIAAAAEALARDLMMVKEARA